MDGNGVDTISEEAAEKTVSPVQMAAALIEREGDAATARTDSRWNLLSFLPPRIQPEFVALAAAFAAQPWAVAAERARDEGRSAPTLDEVAREAAIYFDSEFSMHVIETVAEVRTTLSSASAVELRNPTENEPLTEEEETSFPQAAGAFLTMTSPALEFTKALCHLMSLDAELTEPALRLRRNLLKLLGVAEFAAESRFVNPCRTYVMPDAGCSFCHHVRDIDMCRDATASREWLCTACGSPFEPEIIEARLVAVVQTRALAFISQDRECRQCRVVQRSELQHRCPNCAGVFTLRKPIASFSATLDTFSGIARHFGMPWLLEVCEWQRAHALRKFEP
eukprot:scaffold234274_cov26-Tisochrysis_lutea.AAC.1